jgi:hypothetical protein
MLSFDMCELVVGLHLCFVLNFSNCKFFSPVTQK